MTELNKVMALLCQHAGIDPATLPQPEAQRANTLALGILGIGLRNDPLVDRRPDLLEQKLEDARGEIRRLIEAIEALNPWALAVARRAKSDREFEAKMALLKDSDPEALIAAVLQHTETPPPKEDWPDKAAIRNLRELEDGLKKPIQTLIRKTEGFSDGRGAKPNLVARNLAHAAARALMELTGEPPSYWRDATAFAKLTADLFRLFNVEADTRRACEWALSELEKSA